MLVSDVLGNRQGIAVFVDAHENKARGGHHAFLMTVHIELACFHRNLDGLRSDADDLPVNFDQVVLLHRRLEQHLLHFQCHHVGTEADLIDIRHGQFIDPTEHGAPEEIVVDPEVVFLADFRSEQSHAAKVHLCNLIHRIMSFAHLFSRCAALALFFPLCTLGTAQVGISIDSDFSDWSTIPSVAVEDTAGPLVSVGFTSDAERAYFHLLYDRIIALDEGLIPHGTKLALDLDGNASTGQIVGSFQGAELVVHLKDRYVNTSGNAGAVNQTSLNDAKVRMAPTYGGTEHEVAIDRQANGFTATSAPIRWSVQCSASGQQVQSETPVSLSSNETVAVATPLARAEGTAYRTAFWNMNRRMNEVDAQGAMERILQAVQPDILAMSEVQDFTEAQVQGLLNTWMPIEGGQWNVVKDDWDLMVASRWPIAATYPGVDRQFPVLIDAGEAGEIMVVASHLKCCNGADLRQNQADEYMAFLRDAMTEGGDVDLAPKTPVVYGGDLNMVGPGHAMHTLLTGDIANESAHGPDFAPDWDGTGLRELTGLQTDQAMNYTWLNPNSQWPAGKLDYMLVQDGVLEVLGNFALETASMSPDRLSQFGLEAGDDLQASDHFIIVADLRRHDRPGTKPVKVLKRVD